jgi:putative membrane protein
MKRLLHDHLPAIAATALVAVALVGCQNKGQRDTAGLPGDSVSMAAPGADSSAGTPAQALTDGSIADIALTADAIDSAAGKFALEKSKTKAVRDFAQTMIRDHSAVNQKAVALAQRLGVSPTDNDVSKQLKDGADQAHGQLAGLNGAEFDRAYMDREIAYHQSVLDALDNTLIPGAQNAEFKQFLSSIRPNFEAHLKRAQAVRKDLGGADSTGMRDSAGMR